MNRETKHRMNGAGTATEGQPLSPDVMKAAPVRVLVIEDNPADARFIKEMLSEGENGSFTMEWVDLMEKGLERLSRPGIDAVLLDLGLPDSNGTETFEKVAAAAPTLPVVILSIDDDRPLAVKTVQCGAQDYLVKNHIDGHWLPRAIIYAIERKRTEMHVRQLNERLEKSNIELENFASVASHDLQSPLRNINGFVQLLLEKLQGGTDAETEDWLRRTRQAVQRMQELIHDLLAYSRVSSREKPFELVHFSDVYDGALLSLESSIHDSGAEVTRDELPSVIGDRSQLMQMMQNLIGNALKYRGSRAPKIHVGVRGGETESIFYVSDNGIGIEPRFHEEIFQIFKRLHNQQVYPGTGIGLAVCRRVVNRHGGRIWVESEPGQGSTFYFSIPEKAGAKHEYE
ncbi:MAG TPA: ATP-binding protein [Candidatus Angelobacter sp.]|nr:ATP-binding protein [Candidatus Angelobacter sp.]